MTRTAKAAVYGLVGILVVFAIAQRASAAAPQILEIGPEEVVGAGGRLPSIAADSKGQPHLVFDGGSMVYMYDKIGGAWRSHIIDGKAYTGSGQYYNPHIEIDRQNRAWVSGVLFGGSFGIGIIFRTDMASNPSAVARITRARIQGQWDCGNLSLDPAIPNDVIVGSSNGYWKRYRTPGSQFLSEVESGRMYAGDGGEKNSLWISKAGNVQHSDGTSHAVWHSAIGGYYAYSSSYQNSIRHAQGLSPYPIAAASQYPQQNDDGTYIRVVGDNAEPETAYITQDYKNWGIMMNIWTGGRLVFSQRGVLRVDASGTSGLRRFAPSLAPAKNGGVFVCYTSGSRVKLRYIDKTGAMGPIVNVCAGGLAAACTDKQGNLHIAYSGPNGNAYRKVRVSGSGSIASVAKAGDYNGDGTDDLAVYHPDTGTWYIYLAGSGAVRTVEWGLSGCVPVPADYTGDGVTDLGTYHPDTGIWHLLPLNPDGTTGQPGYLQWGFSGCVPVPADYTGDGVADLAVYYPDTGMWYLKPLASGGDISSLQWGFSGCVPVPADYTGDGVTDLGVYYPDTGMWYLLPMGTSGQPGYLQWGFSGCVPVPADYTGDGVADLGVHNPDTHIWYLKPLGAGGPNGYLQWGFGDCVPVPGDYTGNGMTDLGVYAPDTGMWYLLPVAGDAPNGYLQWGFDPCVPASVRTQ